MQRPTVIRRPPSAASRSRSLSLFTLLVLGLSLVSCGAERAAGSSTPTLRIWYGTDDPIERGWSQQLAQRFRQSHPSIQVRLVDFSFADLNTKLQLALAGGNPPDLAYVTPRGPGIPVYVGAHNLLDLSADARRYGWATKLRPGLLAGYNQPFAGYGAPRGSITAVPTSLAAVGVMYNQRILRRLRIPVPSTPAEFEAALALVKAGGFTPIGMGNADGWLGDDWYLTLVNSLVPAAELRREQRLDPRFSFRRSPYVDAARTLQHWAQRGYFTTDFGGLDAQEGIDLFFKGKTAFQLISSSENAQIMDDQRLTRLPVGVFAYPRAGGGRVVPISGFLGWVIPAQSHNPHAAVSFINQLLQAGTARLLLRHGALPAHRGVLGGFPAPWLAHYDRAVSQSQSGIYLDAAPISNINATMEANVQLLLQGYETPGFLTRSLQEVYASHGKYGSTGRIDGEF